MMRIYFKFRALFQTYLRRNAQELYDFTFYRIPLKFFKVFRREISEKSWDSQIQIRSKGPRFF